MHRGSQFFVNVDALPTVSQSSIKIILCVSDNIQDEIEDFYDDYPDEDSLYPEYVTHQDNKASKQEYNEPKLETIRLFAHNDSGNTQKNIKDNVPYQKGGISNDINFTPVSFKHINITHRQNVSPDHPKWPRFEDMLLAIGKRYDWKNDRWIKVKDKTRAPKKQVKITNSTMEFLSKHKFYYRFVKLNRSKSKRNIILAVNAVR